MVSPKIRDEKETSFSEEMNISNSSQNLRQNILISLS